MRARIRVLAVLGVLLMALCGCQKGQQASKGSPHVAEATKAGSKAGHAESKSGSKSAKSGTGKSGTHEAGKTSSGKEGANVPRGALTMANNEMEFNFKVGQTITVVLDSNKASGLSWNVVEPMGSVIVPQGTGSYAVKAGKAGGGTETWHFRAAKPGYQTVKMEYRRKWAQSMPERTFRFSGSVR
ncbi:MAG TPA: protease inhibitor I42 family protein [Candidatus Angelobacter sp.]|nr:protease inhibitor I42 family protein [Candidatus Angelobacter sp.]